jgi:outer membrane protein assembly factor BamB
MSDGMEAHRAAAIDGKTGQGIWATAAWKGRWPLACPDQATVIAGAGETSVRAFDARTGKERWAGAVPAEPEQITAGEGCASVLVKGGKLATLRIDTGEPAPCASAPEPDPSRGPRWERTRNPRVIQAGDVELQLSAASDGEPRLTPKLTLEGRRGGAAIWTRPLDARASGFGPDLMIAASGGTAVVVGADVASGTRLRFIGVEASSGQILYERPALWAGPYVAAMAVSGPHLVVVAGGSMRALDVASGNEIWQATAPASLPR